MFRTSLLVITIFFCCTAQAQSPEPLLAIPHELVLAEDFDQDVPLLKSTWTRRQGTRWSVRNGILHGEQSSPEYQASKQDHFGYEPRLSIPVTPANFIASFKIRFIGGSETNIAPFIEFDHHVCRVRFSQAGVTLLADHEVWKVAEASEFIWQEGIWYFITAERRGSEFVMQIKDGPTLYAKHPAFATSPASGGKGMGVAGPKKGEIEIDDLKLWSIKKQTQKEWPARRSKFADFAPVQIKTPKPKKSSRTNKSGSTQSPDKPGKRKK